MLTLPIMAALLAGCGMSPQERFERGKAAYAEHKYNEARLDFSSVLQAEPENAAAMGRLVHIFLALENPIAAKGMLDRMADLGKLPPDAAILYGDAELKMGNFDRAISYVEKVRSAEAYRIRGQAHIANDEDDLAEQAFASGRAAPGPKGDLLAANVQFLLAKDKLAEARRLAELAARYRPVTHDALMANGDVAMSQDRLGDALRWYETALKNYPESRLAFLARISVLGRMKRFDAVRPLLKQAEQRYANDSDVVYLNAVLAAEEGKWEKVRQILQPMELGLDGMPLADLLYSRAMLELGHGEQARIRLSSQLLRDPDNRAVRLLLARAKMAVGDAAGAVETMRPVTEDGDATKEELALLAKAEAEAGGA